MSLVLIQLSHVNDMFGSERLALKYLGIFCALHSVDNILNKHLSWIYLLHKMHCIESSMDNVLEHLIQSIVTTK